MDAQFDMLVVGISGPSSSGKTTLARALLKVLPNSIIVHQDDFYKPEAEILVDKKTSLQNWDCPGALDFPALAQHLAYIRSHDGKLPDGFYSKEAENVVSKDQVVCAQGTLDQEARRIKETLSELNLADTRFVLLDGFLLFWDKAVIQELDVKIFVTASYERLKARREARSGYATMEGYWVDPPGYFDDIVWPEYVKWNRHLLPREILDTISLDVTDGSEPPQKVDQLTEISTDTTSVDDMLVAAVNAILSHLSR